MTIEGCGFVKWLEQQKKFLEMIKEKEFSEVMKKRIEYLRAWSIENDLYNKSKLDKIKEKNIT